MNFADAVVDAARGWICRNIDTADRRADYFGRATVSSNGIGIPVGPASNAINDFGRYLYGCPADAGPYPPLAGPQFPNGQCVGSRYNVAWVVDVVGTQAGPRPNNVNVVGPVVGISERVEGNVTILELTSEGGAVVTVVGNFSNSSAAATYDGFRDVVVTPRLGDPDDCGGPPGPGSENFSNNQPITYDGPDGAPVTEPVDVTIGNPIILPDGTAVLPVTVTGPGWEVNVNIPTDGREPTSGPSGGNPGAEGCCPSPAPVEPPPPTDEDPPEEDPNGPILGVIVTTTSPTPAPETTEKGLGSGPTLNIPRLGTVHFGISIGGVPAWMNVIDIKNKRCFVPVPGGLTAIAAEVNPVKGVVFDVKVVYQRPPETDT